MTVGFWEKMLIGFMGAIVGSLANAAWNLASKRKSEQNSLSLELITDFNQKFDHISEALSFLENEESYKIEKGMPVDDKRIKIKNKNQIKNIGNWLNICACLYSKGRVDKKNYRRK